MSSHTRLAGLFLLALAAVGALYAQAQKKSAIAFPAGYRHWTHVKSMVIYSKENPLFGQFGGLHDVYVNDAGLTSLKQGRAYPDGTVFVFDLCDIRTFQGAIETRDRKFVALMKKNAKLYSQTGGWGWEVFQGDSQTGSLQDAKPCFNCHASKKLADYVFSTYVQ